MFAPLEFIASAPLNSGWEVTDKTQCTGAAVGSTAVLLDNSLEESAQRDVLVVLLFTQLTTDATYYPRQRFRRWCEHYTEVLKELGAVRPTSRVGTCMYAEGSALKHIITDMRVETDAKTILVNSLKNKTKPSNEPTYTHFCDCTLKANSTFNDGVALAFAYAKKNDAGGTDVKVKWVAHSPAPGRTDVLDRLIDRDQPRIAEVSFTLDPTVMVQIRDALAERLWDQADMIKPLTIS